MSKKTFKIENGAMLEVPVWCDHKRGKNWAAVISADPASPGGLSRVFLKKASGDYYYLVDGLKPGDPVEFGADYYTGSGHKQPKRYYCIVAAVTDSEIELLECSDARTALEAAKEYQKISASPEIRIKELQIKAQALREELARIEEKIKTLEQLNREVAV